jgi:arylsulfatase A
MQSRRNFLQNIGITAAAIPLLSCTTIGKKTNCSKTPNFVYLFCDDLGYGDLGCFGHPHIQTPNLDRLTQQGMKLTDCYAPAPVCSPSRAGVLTGRNPYRCHIPDWIPEKSGISLKRQEITIARLLQQAGYATCHSGKWHLNDGMYEGGATPGEHGFDHWFSTQNNAYPSHRNPTNFIRNGEKVGPLTGYSSTLIVDEAIEFLKNRDADQPFALFIWFHTPHEPIATAEYFQRLYADIEPENKASYFGNVTQMDYEVGRFLRALTRMNLDQNTFVMFTSDNGPETLNRYRGSQRSYGVPGDLKGMKLHMHEGGIRVPGIIRWPGKTKPGQICGEPVNGTDILPTFCDIVGIDVPTDRAIDGASLYPIFEGKKIKRTKPLYWRYDKALSEAKHAMREGDWKILANANFSQIELYNLAKDKGETTNLITQEPERAKMLLQKLRDIAQEVADDPISK